MKNFIIITVSLLLSVNCFAQQEQNSGIAYKFGTILRHPSTPVKNQAVTGTCWSFTTTSFFESELLRLGKGEHDLSEMFTVRYNYKNRLKDNYLKAGRGNLEEGSLSHMVINVVKEFGMVPEEVYNGINYNSPTHNHKELNQFVKAIAGVAVNLKNRSPQYQTLIDNLLDIFLGPVPEKFDYRGKTYTPITFFSSLGINPDDYVEFTSFSHHPFYEKFVLEIPDNWDSGRFYNLPLPEYMEVIDYALNNGHTVCWGGDMSEKSYSDRVGIAVNATKEELDSEAGRELSFTKIYHEDPVCQDSRQKGFETFVTTDDHLMHLIGKAKDQFGTNYYIVKNSWKPEINRFGGYNYLSENYMKAKTVYIMVHKEAIPAHLKSKLKL